MDTILIVGLGNPGLKYRKTRHNVGFILINELAKELNGKWKKKKELKAELIEAQRNETKIILAKPLTYMNNSGEAVQAIANMFKISSSSLLIIQDDASMKFGKTRIRYEGSAGGHNGIKSIIQHFGSEKFTRFKFGVGLPPVQMALEDWVLRKFSKEEIKEIEKRKNEIINRILAETSDLT